MSPEDIATIHQLLTQRITCRNANEGMSISRLANKLVSHFAQSTVPPQDAAPHMFVHPTQPPNPTPDPTPDPR